MTSSISKFTHLKIPLEEISSATNNFADANLIGQGAFGKVYKGRLQRSEQWIDISARRLDRRYGLGGVEFWTEISMLSSLEHRNMVSIIGFCDEKHEKIIINKYEAKGSLQEYLSASTLTWMQRLKISVGIGNALRYLYKSSVIHHNINSSTILLDDIWEAKLSGFEFSIKNPSSRNDRVLLTDVGGTIGYVDPEYEKTGGVTYKSDVFSFGVVLFEILCGRKAFIQNKHHQFLAPLARLHYGKKNVDEIVDPDLWKSMDPQSFLIFSQVAYSCLEEQGAQRPDIEDILNELEKAHKLQRDYESPVEKSRFAAQVLSTSYLQFLQVKRFEHLKIQLKDILLATDNFHYTYCTNFTRFAMVYKAKLDYFDTNSFSPSEWNNLGELPKRRSDVSIKRINKSQEQHQAVFTTEIEMLSSCKHRNIVSLLGFCDEGNEMIIVYEYASKGRLHNYIGPNNHKNNLPWRLRLKICLDIAHGLKYLHANTDKKQRIIHRDIRSSNILLGNNWEAKICEFGISAIPPSNQQHSAPYLNIIAGTNEYLDPKYSKTGHLKIESDVYSVGVVLFEILFGRMANDENDNVRNGEGFASFARRYFAEGRLKEMVDPKITEKGANQDSLDTFSKVAYQCLAENQAKRPTMEIIIKELQKALHFQENRIISLEDIKRATKNFSHENYIGCGGFGRVYKGELRRANEANTIVAKLLEKGHGQGTQQFFTERQILLEYEHESVIGLVGYCDQRGENIIVSEYMSNGSLDKHLKNFSLSWRKRLEICIDVASGLDFLHSGGSTEEVVIHRDIKSANILLNGNWKAKIADFGLSLISSINTETDFVVKHVCGTPGYLDPLYKESNLLTRESDIYSFGVVLFEILSGRFAYKRNNEDFLTMLVKNSFQEGKLDEVVFEGIKDHIDRKSLTTFQMIAYQCLHEEREKRPTASEVMVQLKKALEFQHLNPLEHLRHLRIPFQDIFLATEKFSEKYYIASRKSAKVYKANLNHFDSNSFSATEWKNDPKLPKRSSNVFIKRLSHTDYRGGEMFGAEIENLQSCKHRNIDTLLGFCDEGTERIVVYECASKGRLDDYLESTDHMGNLSWGQRLKICLGIAHGLDYLHTSSEEKQMIIHGDITSTSILLGNNWEAKITDFGFSKILPSYQQDNILFPGEISGREGYLDPEYVKTGKLSRASDIYSFGVVLFKILCGGVVYNQIYDLKNVKGMQHLARKCFDLKVFDPKIKEEFDLNVFDLNKERDKDSLDTFSRLAYRCLAETQVERPPIEVVVMELEKALDLHRNRTISLEDIKLATENFSDENCIRDGGGKIYKGELQHDDGSYTNIFAKQLDGSYDQRKHEFLTECEILLEYKHENVIRLTGCCDQLDEKIIVYEHMSNGGLDRHLKNVNLSWTERLKICIDIASALVFLHGGALIHRDIKSGNILLNGDWKAKIADFGLALRCSINKETDFVVNCVCGTPGYSDPLYKKSGLLTRESDIYSFGVVLFETLSGRLAYQRDNEEFLTMLVKHSFQEGKQEELVFNGIKDQIFRKSLTTFQRIAYQCLNDVREERPTATEVMLQLKKALEAQKNHTLPLEDIKLATRNFSDENCIGNGGFWKIYKGELQHDDGSNTNIIAKRLDRSYGQQQHEFFTECEILLECKHENVIGLIGYCDQMDENIIVYEQMFNGGLDSHLKNVNLSWTKRLKICIDVASGLVFLHGGALMQELVIHRDIKSTNILLDGDWKAKIADFDPLYVESGSSTRESDIYSLGLVLFEILSGRLTYEKENDEPLTELAKHIFDEGMLDEIVFEGIKEQIAPESLATFQMIASQCLHDEKEKRPLAGEVVLQLKEALKFQENHERILCGCFPWAWTEKEISKLPEWLWYCFGFSN